MQISIDRVMIKEVKRGTSKTGFQYGIMELIDTDTSGELSVSFNPEADTSAMEKKKWQMLSCVLEVRPKKNGFNQGFELLEFHFAATKVAQPKEG